MTKELVPVEANPYSIMDAMDDSLILAELENRVSDYWVYDVDGTVGLSKKGVDECCTEMAKQGHIIREGEVTWKEDPTNKQYLLFQGTATRWVIDGEGKQHQMETVVGVKRHWLKMKAKGQIVPDPFWFEKGSMKALRNARSRLIPAEIQAKIIAAAKQSGKVRTKKTTTPQNKPPAKDKEMSKAQAKFIMDLGKARDWPEERVVEMVRWKAEQEGIDNPKSWKVVKFFLGEKGDDPEATFDSVVADFIEFKASESKQQEDIPFGE